MKGLLTRVQRKFVLFLVARIRQDGEGMDIVAYIRQPVECHVGMDGLPVDREICPFAWS